MEWILPDGWTITVENGTHSVIDIEVPASALPGTYTLQAWSCSDDPANLISYEVNVQPQDPEAVSPASQLCIDYGDTGILSFTASPAGNYEWEYPPGWTLIGSADSETLILQPDGSTTGEVTAGIIGVDGCNSEEKAVWEVNLNPVTPDAFVVDCWNYGNEDLPSMVSINNAPDPFYGGYTITDPSGDFLTGYTVDEDTGEISLTVVDSLAAGSYDLEVTHTTALCGTSTNSTLTINYDANGMSLGFIPLGGSDLFQVTGGGVSSSTDITWLLDGTPVPSVPNTNNVIILSGSNPPDEVCAEITLNGCTTTLCRDGETHGTSSLQPGEDISIIPIDLKVYPNPSDGDFNISLGHVEEGASLQILNEHGGFIERHPLKEGENSLNTFLPTGSYWLLIVVDGQRIVHRIGIAR